jgi:lipoprotein-anchoring transpeptidase ErfK/SrfK
MVKLNSVPRMERLMLRTRVLALAFFAVSPSIPAMAGPDKPNRETATVTDTTSGTTTYFGETGAQAAAAVAKPKPQPLPDPTLTASVDLVNQTMVVSVNGEARYSWPISSGTAQYPTPTGSFRPEWTSKMWYSRKYDWAPMPNAVFISGGVAVHGTYHTGALGSPASHGCIRLSVANAKTFYNLVERHGLKMTRVTVFGTPKWRGPAMANRDSSRKVYVANQDSNWFWGSWGGDQNSAYAPNFTKKKNRKGDGYSDRASKKVYRLSNGDYVYVQRPPKRSYYKTYGYGYGGYSQGY